MTCTRLPWYLSAAWLLGWVLTSCGSPNPFEFQNELSPPREVTMAYDGTALTLKVVGFYATNSAPDFSGYNIYLDRVSTPTTIRERLLLGDTAGRPTLPGQPSSQIMTNEIRLTRLWVSNLTTATSTLDPLAPQDVYYLIVTAWAGRANQESGYDSIQEIRIPLWLENQQVVNGQTFTSGAFQLQFTSGTISPVGGCLLQAMGPSADPTLTVGAPASGYLNAPMALATSNLYYVYAQSNFGKLWVQNIQGATTTFRWSMLVGSPLL